MITEIDQDGNGCISFNEFVYLMTKNVHEDGDIEEEIREAFRVFDREGHGYIAVPDLCQVLTTLGDKLTEDESLELISEADIDGDGRGNGRSKTPDLTLVVAVFFHEPANKAADFARRTCIKLFAQLDERIAFVLVQP